MAQQKSQSKFSSNKKVQPVKTTGYDCGELLEVLKSIQQAIKCYSCHKAIRTARTCINGHGLCWNCKNRYNRICPVCRSMVLDVKPTMLNDIIKLLPRSCNFVNKGCEILIFANSDDNDDHETFCRFRQTTCRMPSCGWKGMAKDLLLHLEKYHGREMIRTASQTQILVNFNTKTDKEGLAVIIAFNNIFWQHVRVKQNRLMQFYQYVPMEKPTNKYKVLISFHSPNAKYTDSTPVHTDMVDPRQLFNDKETFCLPKKEANSFNRSHSGIHYEFVIMPINS